MNNFEKAGFVEALSFVMNKDEDLESVGSRVRRWREVEHELPELITAPEKSLRALSSHSHESLVRGACEEASLTRERVTEFEFLCFMRASSNVNLNLGDNLTRLHT